MTSTDTQLKRKLSDIVQRKTLPAKRRGFTQKAKIGGQVIFLRTGEYSDDTLGEIFIDLAKEGSTLRSLMNCFAIAVSVGFNMGYLWKSLWRSLYSPSLNRLVWSIIQILK